MPRSRPSRRPCASSTTPVQAIHSGLVLGRQAASLFAQHLEEGWVKSLELWRRELNLEPGSQLR